MTATLRCLFASSRFSSLLLYGAFWPSRSASERCPGPRRRDNGWRLFSMSLAKWLRNKRLDPRLIGIWRRDGVHCAPLALKGAMKSPTPDAHVFRFGVFELDARSGELRRHGLKIRLPDQSFQILRALLMRPGELVTRDELRQLLWTAETFVDFEVGLNSAVRKLREALDDSADNPRFVETVPRRGYRFVGPVIGPAVDRAPPAAHGVRHARSSRIQCRPSERDSGLARPSLCPRPSADQPALASPLAGVRRPCCSSCLSGSAELPTRRGLLSVPRTPPRPQYRSGPSSCCRSRT